MAFDTYKAVQELKKAVFEEEQAAAIVAMFRWAATGQYTSYAKWFAKSDDAEASDIVAVATRSDAESSWVSEAFCDRCHMLCKLVT